MNKLLQPLLALSIQALKMSVNRYYRSFIDALPVQYYPPFVIIRQQQYNIYSRVLDVENVEGMSMNQQKVEKNALHTTKHTLQSAGQSPAAPAPTSSEQISNCDHEYTQILEPQASRPEQADGVVGVSVILERMVAYFADRTHGEDLNVLSFSLRHLFGCMDYLYRSTLPELLKTPMTKESPEQSPMDNLLCRHTTWTRLRSIKQTLNRVEPLCDLLNDVVNRMLDALDLTSSDVEKSLAKSALQGALYVDEQEWLRILNLERWDLALANLTACLHLWREEYGQCSLFIDYFAQLLPAMPSLARLDDIFATILDISGALFGDILPNFQALSPGDDEIAATLLFDLMQQVDQLLLQFDLTIEPLHTLTEHFALGLHS